MVAIAITTIDGSRYKIPVVNNPNPSETWVRLRKFSCPSIVKVNNATIKTSEVITPMKNAKTLDREVILSSNRINSLRHVTVLASISVDKKATNALNEHPH